MYPAGSCWSQRPRVGGVVPALEEDQAAGGIGEAALEALAKDIGIAGGAPGGA